MLSESTCNLLLQIGQVLIGGIITWVAACIYYKKAGDDLKLEAQELRKLNKLTIKAIEERGLARFNRDEEGNLVGIVLGAISRDGINLSDKPSSTDTE